MLPVAALTDATVQQAVSCEFCCSILLFLPFPVSLSQSNLPTTPTPSLPRSAYPLLI